MDLNESYPTIYRDKIGEVKTTLYNNGELFSMTVREVTFTSSELDSLEPSIPLDHPQLEQFTLAYGAICNYEIEFDIPLITVIDTKPVHSKLHVHLKLGAAVPNRGIKSECLRLRLDCENQSYFSCGKHGWFDDEMREIEAALPENIYMKCCHTCAFSDYHPTGYGLIGGLCCFRDNKQGYMQAKGKFELMRIWDTKTEFVQETYLCPEYEKRTPDTGYRG